MAVCGNDEGKYFHVQGHPISSETLRYSNGRMWQWPRNLQCGSEIGAIDVDADGFYLHVRSRDCVLFVGTELSPQVSVKPTVARSFLASMRDLNETLLKTTCNFARCIKPNAAMQCGVYENK